ncbi:hypothetical protein [Halorubrum laminariae]|uniref:PGF-CTERM sorting domain-containing protein n=1 Tax=Halorubrum laminariae TaxID=1433523 RepID=A0ABD6BZG6_9EURY|nr:hypothetical protein [Halorubrum laminariae]
MNSKPPSRPRRYTDAPASQARRSGVTSSQIAVWSVCLAISILLASAGPLVAVAAGQQDSGPQIDIAIDGEPVADGGERIVQSDPTANITVASNTSIDLIEIRVDGEIRHSYRPENRSFSRAVPLELGLNDNDVEIIADAERVATFEATVTKRTGAPRVKYTSPFTTTVKGGPPDETTVPTGEVTIAGSLHTVSTVDRVTIERTFTYDLDNDENETDRDMYRIEDPGEEFSQDLRLGVGENDIVMRYVDAAGKTNTDEFTLVVDDETAPKMELDVPNVSYSDSARIRGSVSDETKLDRVTLERVDADGSQVLLTETDPGPDAERLNVTVDTRVALHHTDEPNEFRLVAEDTAGNTNEREFAIEHDPDPQVSVSVRETNTTAETVRLAGNITDADVTRVTLETIDTDSGERLDIVRAHETAGPVESVTFDRTLTAAPGRTVANLLVTHDGGAQYTESITPRVDESTESTTESEDGDEDNAGGETEGDGDVGDGTGDATTSMETPETGDGNTGSSSGTTDESAQNPDKNGDDGGDGSDSGPPLFPFGVGTREALGGVVVVGSVYVLGLRV